MLKGYIAPTKSVPLPGGQDPLALRGLSLHDVAAIVRDYKQDITIVWKQFEGLISGQGVQNLDLSAVITVAMQSAPLLVAQIIATAANEPNEWDIVAKLPITVQLAAIQAVTDLTFEGEGGAKNVLEAVLRLIGGVGGLVNRKPNPRPRQGEITVGSDGMPTSGNG